MSRPYITRRARLDIARILARSELLWGEDASFRYEKLILMALADIVADPYRVGSRARPELGRGIRSWHLRLSRERARTPTGIVNQPRHFIFYRLEVSGVVVVHVLGDSQDARRHFAK